MLQVLSNRCACAVKSGTSGRALPATPGYSRSIETVHTKSDSGTFDCRMISVLPLLQMAGVLLVVAAAKE